MLEHDISGIHVDSLKFLFVCSL